MVLVVAKKIILHITRSLHVLFAPADALCWNSKVPTYVVCHSAVSDHHSFLSFFTGDMEFEKLITRHTASVNGFRISPSVRRTYR